MQAGDWAGAVWAPFAIAKWLAVYFATCFIRVAGAASQDLRSVNVLGPFGRPQDATKQFGFVVMLHCGLALLLCMLVVVWMAAPFMLACDSAKEAHGHLQGWVAGIRLSEGQ